MSVTAEPLRIANCSGFYGDRLAAARDDRRRADRFLTGDYLAELTMLILWKSRQKDVAKGYATTFLRQMEDVLGLAIDRGVKIVTNAGGLNPAGLAAGAAGARRQAGAEPEDRPSSTATIFSPRSRHCAPPATICGSSTPADPCRIGGAADHRERLPGGLGNRRGAARAGRTSSSARA